MKPVRALKKTDKTIGTKSNIYNLLILERRIHIAPIRPCIIGNEKSKSDANPNERLI